MAERVFVDTAYVIAVINPRDQHHERAMAMADEAADRPLLTTDGVLLEIGNALARSYREQAVELIERFILSEQIIIVHVTSGLFERALDLYRTHRDKTWSLVDCSSFIVMRRMNLTDALTPDRHFLQAGFRPLM